MTFICRTYNKRMDKVNVKGHEIKVKVTKSAYDRKSILFANNIIAELKKLGIEREDVKIETNIAGNKNEPALIEFWSEGYYCRFSYSMTKRFIDNMYVIMKLIETEVSEVLTGAKEIYQFYQAFSSEVDRKEIKKELAEAKKVLGLNEEKNDVGVIDQVYKKLARKNHPDMGGSLEEFQKINWAHKLIKKEMGL